MASSSANAPLVIPWVLKILRICGVIFAKMPSIRCSTETYSSPMLFAAFSAERIMRSVSEARYISPPETFGRVEM